MRSFIILTVILFSVVSYVTCQEIPANTNVTCPDGTIISGTTTTSSKSSFSETAIKTFFAAASVATNLISRAFGWFEKKQLPSFLEVPLIREYIKYTGANLSEAAETDLSKYKSLNDFFTRELKPDIRPIDQTHSLVSPCDGLLVVNGPVTGDKVEQVKGTTYSLSDFFGQPINNLTVNAGTILYQSVIYLSPGDYHRFHSPADWSVLSRKYFPGALLTVNPHYDASTPNLFSSSERAVYFGSWQHGFFSMTLVAAFNVGDIKVYIDKNLPSNTGLPGQHQETATFQNVQVSKGDEFGLFNFGSTIVLIFEAPKCYQFSAKIGDKLKYGQALGA